VHDESELGPAVELARQHDEKVLVEEFVAGTLSVGIGSVCAGWSVATSAWREAAGASAQRPSRPIATVTAS
jgi:hypothetical protein